jgi:hypothetical protein
VPSDLLKNGRVVPNWRLGVAASLASDFRFNSTTKNVLQKSRVEKFLQKNRQKIQNRLFLGFFNHVLGRFSARGVKKHDKNLKKNLTSTGTGTFLASED